ncbi:MAG TPA: anthranilate synthase component I [Longimicrobiales bacterium]|nr:anthranilate synthase component I [Longimicrobiales bacterium]
MRVTTFEEFRALAGQGTFVPVCKEIVADLLTPVSAFLKIAEHSDEAFLLESVEGGEHMGRYSFLGKDPFLILRARDGRTTVERAGHRSSSERPFLDELRELMAAYRAPPLPGLPRFTGGAVGYLGYDVAPSFEPALPARGAAADDDAGFMVFDTVLAFDHVRHRILLISNARLEGAVDLEALYRFACAKISFLERELARTLSQPQLPPDVPLAVTSSVTRPQFEGMVRTAKEHIAAGDVYQVVLSQAFEARTEADPFTVYRALRHVNPSPYMYFLRSGGRAIVGASPEMLVRVEGTRVETHPIAGTRPRGRDELDDMRLAEELKRDEKERSEHVMLVDLGRNDIGRVAEYGSVRVPTFMGIEKYSHVMHLVSAVEGRLAAPHDRLDALVACFPAGTVSGAPKIRAMEIIAALEPQPRGVYAGAVGYLDFSGNLDFCIAIRTVVIERGRARFQAGAGIVIGSDPATEYAETCAKAEAVLQALRLAQDGLGARGTGGPGSHAAAAAVVGSAA